LKKKKLFFDRWISMSNLRDVIEEVEDLDGIEYADPLNQERATRVHDEGGLMMRDNNEPLLIDDDDDDDDDNEQQIRNENLRTSYARSAANLSTTYRSRTLDSLGTMNVEAKDQMLAEERVAEARRQRERNSYKVRAKSRSRWSRFRKAHWPFTQIRALYTFVLLLCFGAVAAVSYVVARGDVLMAGEPLHNWATYACVLTAAVLLSAFGIGCVVWVIGTRWSEKRIFWFVSGLRAPTIGVATGAVSIAFLLVVMTDLGDNWKDGLMNTSISIIVIAGSYGVRVIWVKWLLLRNARTNYFGKITKAIFNEKVLYKILKYRLAKERETSGIEAPTSFAKRMTSTLRNVGRSAATQLQRDAADNEEDDVLAGGGGESGLEGIDEAHLSARNDARNRNDPPPTIVVERHPHRRRSGGGGGDDDDDEFDFDDESGDDDACEREKTNAMPQMGGIDFGSAGTKIRLLPSKFMRSLNIKLNAVAPTRPEQVDEGTMIIQLETFAKRQRPEFLLANRLEHSRATSSSVNYPSLMKRAEQQERAEVDAVSRLAFDALDADGKGYVTEDDFDVLYAGRPFVRQDAFVVFNPFLRTRVDFGDFRSGVLAIYKTRRFLARSLEDRDDIAGVLNAIFGGLFWSIMFFVVLSIFGVDIVTVVLPFFSFFLGFSFAFGPTIRGMLESAIMVLAEHPFAIGDRVWIAERQDSCFIERITLFNTTVRTTDNRYIEYPNELVTSQRIVNFTRSSDHVIQFAVRVAFHTPIESIYELIDEVTQFCVAHPKLAPDPLIWIDRIETMSALELGFWVTCDSLPWSAPGLYLPMRQEVLARVKQIAERLRIEFTMPIQPVHLEHVTEG
jgi:small-conductance mechanosensitive channel